MSSPIHTPAAAAPAAPAATAAAAATAAPAARPALPPMRRNRWDAEDPVVQNGHTVRLVYFLSLPDSDL